MLHLLKGAEHLTAHPLGGTVGPQKFRICLFQLLQLPEQQVIFKVRHFRIIQHVITVVGIFQQLYQLIDSLFRLHRCLLFVKMYWEPAPQ